MSTQKVIGSKPQLYVDLDSKVLCVYCNKGLSVSGIGQHFSSVCKGAFIAKGKDPDGIMEKNENAKKRRNLKEKEKRKSWDYKYEQALKRWQRNLLPKIPFRFIPVSPQSPFFWSVKDRDLKVDVFTKSEREKFGNFLFPALTKFGRQFTNRLEKELKKKVTDKDDLYVRTFKKAMTISLSFTLHPDKNNYGYVQNLLKICVLMTYGNMFFMYLMLKNIHFLCINIIIFFFFHVLNCIKN